MAVAAAAPSKAGGGGVVGQPPPLRHGHSRLSAQPGHGWGRHRLAAVAAALGAAGAAATDPDERRVAALPDVHGDLEALRGALRLGGADLAAAGPSLPTGTTLLSLGDLVDRGPDGPACYALLSELAGASAGLEGGSGGGAGPGAVVRLLGNHEWLNLLGVDRVDHPDTRSVQEDLLASYVHPEEIQALGGWPGRLVAFGPEGALGRQIAGEFELLALLPRPWRGPGLVAEARRLPPLDAAATLFLHGGISLATARRYPSAAALAAEAREQLRTWAAGVGGPEALLPGAGPPGGTVLFDELLQDRTLAESPEEVACPELEGVLAHFGAARLVLGHTPQLGGSRWGAAGRARRARVRCGGRLVLLDVAMSRWLLSMRRPEAAPRPAVLELRYRPVAGAEDNDVLTGLRVLYGGLEGQAPEEELLPPFGSVAGAAGRAEL